MTHIGALGVLEVVLSLWKCLSLFEVIKNNNNNNNEMKEKNVPMEIIYLKVIFVREHNIGKILI